jgi:hypothetical protein
VEGSFPKVETVQGKVLAVGWAQGFSVATAAFKKARRCTTLAARCAMNRRMYSGDTLVFHQGGRT